MENSDMIRIGTCGFSFKDWKGTVYPKDINNSDILDYYNRKIGLDLVEIDVSYYTYVSRRAVESWVAKTGNKFLFSVKCHKEMTLNEVKPENMLAIDNAESFGKFINTYKPLADSGKLLTFLAQFGPMFFKSLKNQDYIKKMKETFEWLPLTAEFRHKSWLADNQKDDTFNFLKNQGVGYTIVDEPAVRSLAPFVSAVTSSVAYFRLHGRSQNWFGGDPAKRYDYLYSDKELEEFIPFIENLDKKSRITAVLFNNCHAGAALKNAIKLKQMLGMANYIEEAKTRPEQIDLPFE
jgi:uncharacterized protein YecE (DUF72 family)